MTGSLVFIFVSLWFPVEKPFYPALDFRPLSLFLEFESAPFFQNIESDLRINWFLNIAENGFPKLLVFFSGFVHPDSDRCVPIPFNRELCWRRPIVVSNMDFPGCFLFHYSDPLKERPCPDSRITELQPKENDPDSSFHESNRSIKASFNRKFNGRSGRFPVRPQAT